MPELRGTFGDGVRSSGGRFPLGISVIVAILVIIGIAFFVRQSNTTRQSVASISYKDNKLEYVDATGTVHAVDLTPLRTSVANARQTYSLDGTKLTVTSTNSSTGEVSKSTVDLAPAVTGSAPSGPTAAIAPTANQVQLKGSVLTVNGTKVDLASVASPPRAADLLAGSGVNITGGTGVIVGRNATVALDVATVSSSLADQVAVASDVSITGDGTTGNALHLLNDAAVPGTLRYYGTDVSGVKGWHDLSGLISGGLTTNTLSSSGNTMTSTVNTIVDTAPIINTNALHLTGTSLTSDVNGVTSAGVDISAAVDASITKGNLTSGSGAITVTGGTGAVFGGGTSISIVNADGTHTGLLVSSDWTIFNGKESALTFTGSGLYSRTGNTVSATTCVSNQIMKYNGTAWACAADAAGAGTVTSVTAGTGLNQTGTATDPVLSLSDVGTAGTYGSATQIPVVTTNAQGRVTGVAATTIAGLTTSNLAANAGITNAQLANAGVTVNTSGPLTGGGSVSLGGSLTLACASCITSIAGGDLTSPNSAIAITGGTSAVLGTGATIDIVNADGTHTGLLTSSDWGAFTSKENALTFTGNGMFGRTGNTISAATCALNEIFKFNGTAWACAADGGTAGTVTSVTAGAGLSQGGTASDPVIDMPSVGTAATYGSAAQIPVITTDAQGRVSGVAATTIAGLTTGNLAANAAITNSQLANSSVAINTSGPLSGGGSVALGGSLTLACASCITSAATGNLTTTTTGITITGGTGAVLGGVAINIVDADSTHTGLLSSGDWDTFSNKQDALTLGNATTTTTGVIITGGTGAVVGAGITMDIQTADATHNGLLSSVDWGTFSGKENVLTFTGRGLFSRTGNTVSAVACNLNEILKYNGSAWACAADAGGTGTVASVTAGTGLSQSGTATDPVLGLPDVGTAGTYGSATQIPVVTTDAQGRITGVSATAITGLTTSNLAAGAGILNTQLANSGVTITTSGALSGGGTVALGGNISLSCSSCVTSSSLSDLAAANGISSIDNLNYEQVWNWSTATTEDALSMNADALTSGNGFVLGTSSTDLTGNLASFTASGDGAGVTGNVLSVAMTGASSVGNALYVSNSGTGFAINVPVGAVRFGDATNNMTVNGSTFEPTLAGTARHAKKITLVAQYSGSSLDASGTNNNGTMTTGFDGANRKSYYKWTTTQGTNQNYDVVVQLPLPSDWSAWASSTPIAIDTYSSDTTNGTIVGTLMDTNGTVETAWNACALTPSAATTWQVKTGCAVTGTYVADGTATLRLRLQSPTSGDVRTGTITLSYLSKF